MTQDSKLEIVRRGDIYCDPECGRGCTHAEYCHAVVNAEELVENLGEGWTTRVWDNLGWHYAVHYKYAGLMVYPTRDGKYHACIDHLYHSDNYDTPQDAVGDSLGKLNEEIIDLVDIYGKITGWHHVLS